MQFCSINPILIYRGKLNTNLDMPGCSSLTGCPIEKLSTSYYNFSFLVFFYFLPMLNGLRSILQLQMCAVAKPGTFPRRGQSENATSVGDQLKCANKIGGPSHIKVTERFNSIPKGGRGGSVGWPWPMPGAGGGCLCI